MTPEAIQTLIADHVDADYVLAESVDNVHFYVTVVSAAFEGMTKIKQHKLIKDLFAEQFADETIHAMSLKTFTPQKWALKQASDD